MASSSTQSIERDAGKSTDSRKRLPEDIIDLLDVAIFSFSCQSGLRSVHKIRGDPVLEGVSAFFGHLMRTANADLQAKLSELSPSRLGGWQPGEAATTQLLTLVSSRIKTLNQKQLIREDRNPTVPSLLVEKREKYIEEEDRVKTSLFARCWRCKSLCQYCSKMMRRVPNFGNFRTDMTSHFLDVMETMIESREDDRDDDDDDSDDDDSNDLQSTGENCDAEGESSADEDNTNLKQCLTDVDFPGSEKDSDNKDCTNKAKNVSRDDAHEMASESDSYEEDEGNQGNESEELFSASEED